MAIMPIKVFANPVEDKKPNSAIGDELKNKEEKIKELQRRQEELANQLNKVTKEYQEAYTKYVLIKEKVKRNQQKLDEISIELDLNQEKLNKRVVQMYKNREDLMVIDFLLSFDGFDALINNLKFINIITKKDLEIVSDTKELKDEAENKQSTLEQQKISQQEALSEVETKKNDMKRNLDAQNMLSKLFSEDIIRLKKQAAIIDGLELSIMFPVNGAHSFINDWGFPRSGGRHHRGTDIFAQTGTPLVAVTDGYIGKASEVERGLGGITLWLHGNDGHQYYYAHLSGIEKGIVVGTQVSAGQTIGYVGNTGNARSTPPHLHFQIHPNGGEPVNPYPFLKAVDPYS